jgi:glycosyltransferase involved in cell wall biosynthesis
VIPSDPLRAYGHKSDDYLRDYFNPTGMFEEVFVLSPLEPAPGRRAGMTVVPTRRRQLRRRLREHRIDVVRAYGGFWACDMACRHKEPGVPVVVSVHDSSPRLLYRSIRRADAVFCVSEVVRRLVLSRRPEPDRTFLLPNRVDLDLMRPSPATPPAGAHAARRHVLHVGRKSPEKNLEAVIGAVALLGEDYELVAVGPGDAAPYRQIARRLGVEGRCLLLPGVPQADLPGTYSWADCLCVPSLREGFGMVFIEALACGAVVVTSDLAPMNEYIRQRENGLLVSDPRDPAALAAAIREACTDAALRARVRGAARASVARFDKRRIDRMEADLYRRVLEERRGAAIRRRFWPFGG